MKFKQSTFWIKKTLANNYFEKKLFLLLNLLTRINLKWHKGITAKPAKLVWNWALEMLWLLIFTTGRWFCVNYDSSYDSFFIASWLIRKICQLSLISSNVKYSNFDEVFYVKFSPSKLWKEIIWRTNFENCNT